MKWLSVGCALALLACASCARAPHTANQTLRASCPQDQYWDGRSCQPRGDGARALDQGESALGEFRVDEALEHLDRALEAGPHRHAGHVRIHEQLGIARAYLGLEAEALAAFDMLLSLNPGHLLSYTLSPKATFLFERARKQALSRPRPAVHLSWPYDLDVTRPIPIDVEVVADPRGLLQRAELHVRAKGRRDEFSVMDLRLPEPGDHRRLTLPELDTGRPEVLELYLTALDAQGNEVLLWVGPERPREIALGYEPPVPWYRTWWTWAVIGTAVAASTGAVVYAISREPPDAIGGSLVIPR